MDVNNTLQATCLTRAAGSGPLSGGSPQGSLASLTLPGHSSNLSAASHPADCPTASSDGSSINRSSSAALEVLASGTGVLLRDTQLSSGGSLKSRRCPFVIGVAGGTGTGGGS